MDTAGSRRGGRQPQKSPSMIPHYSEAMTMIANWEVAGDDFEGLINRLYHLWNEGSETVDLR